MSTCPHCGATVPEDAVYCSKCGTAINSPSTSMPVSQTQVTSQMPPTTPNVSGDSDMSKRLQKATRRAELLGYAAAGLGLAILAVIILISLL
jgi:uncharacterized membrane protein YvbJ